ncbi:MAG: sel1 repeat family protein [Candidatus Methanogranum gryphiswaldense]|nr:MAG: sel1 repeat family protein [Candidatus Methanogranum sp. U3.2.1]
MSSQSIISEDDQCFAALSIMDVSSKNYDMKKALSTIEPLASQGNIEAQYIYGLFLYTGTHIDQDRISAFKMFRSSAVGNNPEALLLMTEYDKLGEGQAFDDLLSLKFKAKQRDVDACSKLFEIYSNGGALVKKDHKIALSYCTVCAEKGNIDSMSTIGFMYLMGKGVSKDKEKAMYWLKKAADLGSGEAMYRIGSMYEEGLCFTEPDLKEAAKWYTFSASAGNKDGQYSMAAFCCAQKTKYYDPKRAAQLFQAAADQGHIEAAYQIGMTYAFGEGAKRDTGLAIKYLEMACEGGSQQAMVDYANMRFEGTMLPKDEHIAAKWFEVAANRCDGTAQYALACMYGNGIHFEKSDEMAAKWFRESAEMGDANSQYCLGCFCYEGRGCTKDAKEAASWFEQAAEQGQPAAKSFLGMMMVSGKDIPQDVESGVAMLHEAADDHGYYEAQYYLGKIYSEGKYVLKNIPLAKKYLAMAAKQGDADAVALIDKIKAEKIR